MKKDSTAVGIVASGVETAWEKVAASFERFCLTAGIATLVEMMERDAVGVDGEGAKHPLGLLEGASENSAVVQALLDNLVERGLDPAREVADQPFRLLGVIEFPGLAERRPPDLWSSHADPTLPDHRQHLIETHAVAAVACVCRNVKHWRDASMALTGPQRRRTGVTLPISLVSTASGTFPPARPNRLCL